MYSKTWDEVFKISSQSVTARGELGLYGLLNLIQETAWQHAERIGFGATQMAQDNLYWVMTRQHTLMNSWPAYGETIRIRTWLRPPEGAFVLRGFKIFNLKDEVIGHCTTSFLALEQGSGKILPVQDLRPWDVLISEDPLTVDAEKIPVRGEYQKLTQFAVRNSDLDINLHVNNAKYAQWILDSVPFELHKVLKLNSYSVNFLAETLLGDTVEIQGSVTDSTQDETKGSTVYRGVRTSDGKNLFTARMDWEKR
ncbi:thioesterase [Bdellovibrio sp. SKB1291214]|uniref:acyl-[acyl-carrier-protein] thioesterase n=1 Tax=Bdellovibrio sp. SKB1291214 TaxID=1732569 RepID=UPI000B51A40B|nr:acyl-ACP thioesterase domain-containing protein [Bdellovibrio sp. SKB1291214]UYL07596.1 thioesterase [Bdellovibrio sp. SKB1291214]